MLHFDSCLILNRINWWLKAIWWNFLVRYLIIKIRIWERVLWLLLFNNLVKIYYFISSFNWRLHWRNIILSKFFLKFSSWSSYRLRFRFQFLFWRFIYSNSLFLRNIYVDSIKIWMLLFWNRSSRIFRLHILRSKHGWSCCVWIEVTSPTTNTLPSLQEISLRSF